MDIETGNTDYYRFSEKGILKRNPKLWDKVNSHVKCDVPFKEKFFLFENHILDVPKCYCGNSVKFVDMVSGYREFCSRKCMLDSDGVKNRRKKTCVEKYGVDNPSKSDRIKSVVKSTNQKKFGVDYPLQSKEILDSYKSTMVERYGVDNPSKNEVVRSKAKQTNIERFGVEHPIQNKEVSESLKKYFLDKYGADNPFKIKGFVDKSNKSKMDRFGTLYPLQNEEVLKKMINTNLERYGSDYYTKTDEYKMRVEKSVFQKNSDLVNDGTKCLLSTSAEEYQVKCLTCGETFVIQRQLWRNRKNNGIEVCLSCNPIFKGSVDEKSLLLFIKENYGGEIIENYKIGRIEIDIFLPELNIGFEFNGIYWHSELQKGKSYHYNKYKFFEDKGIQVISIWEDKWIFKKDLVKSMVLNKIGSLKSKIYARKCSVRKIEDNSVVRNFLDENHLQGYVVSSHKMGLYYGEELVSIMTFGNLRKSLGQKSRVGSFEMLRFCNKKNMVVVGGASKLLNFFMKKFNPDEIISYSLNDYSTGDLYGKLGFEYVSESKSNYFWVKNKVRYHRFSFRKDKLVKDGFDEKMTEVEIMYQRGFLRIFDSGSKKWIIKNGDL
jgi:hypothetical protein